jgi:hypothetical protein
MLEMIGEGYWPFCEFDKNSIAETLGGIAMNKNNSSKVTRRAMIAALGGLAAMRAGTQGREADKPPVASNDQRVMISKITNEWHRLLPLWQEENKQNRASYFEFYWKGSHGKAIIALGPAIIPYLIQQIRKGDSLFNVPLEWITNIDIANGKHLSEPELSKLWLKWWDGGNE